MAKTKFNIGEEVWVWFDPDVLENPESPILKGSIVTVSCTTTMSVQFENNVKIDDISTIYEIRFGFGSSMVSESNIYVTNYKATEAFLEYLNNKMLRLESKLDELYILYENLSYSMRGI